VTQVKAIVAGVVAFVAPAGALLIANKGHMTGADWLVAAGTCIVVYSATYLAPKNKV
jgi:hypothetical protein